MFPLLFLLVTATIRPAHPTIGDPVTIEFSAPVVLDPSADYEIVARSGTRVVIRTFQTKPIVIRGFAGDARVSMTIPLRSVLKPKDTMEPAPLKPPRPEPWPRLPFIAIGIAAAAAIAAWTAVVLLARRRHAAASRQVVVPVERFRSTVLALRDAPRASMRWAALADATRAYLSAVQPHLGSELTTSELLSRLGNQPIVAQILRQGDLEKFSPWGAGPANFEELANRALEIPAWAEPVLAEPQQEAA